MSVKDGGPAFPTECGIDAETCLPLVLRGMSLRDYFAGQALTRCQPEDDDNDFAGLAKWAYGVADAMLAARNASTD